MINQVRFFSVLFMVQLNCTIITAQITKPLDLTDFSKYKVENLNPYHLESGNVFDKIESISMNYAPLTTIGLSSNNFTNYRFNPPPTAKEISIFPLPESANYNDILIKNAYQNTLFEGKEKIWKPSSEDIMIGSVFMLLGYSAVFIPPFPDFNSDKMGPQLLFILGGSAALVGTGALIAGIFNHTTINYPEVFPYPPNNQMSLLPAAKNDSIKASIAEILNQGQIRVKDMTTGSKGISSNAAAFDDRVEFMVNNQKTVISFDNLYTYGVTTLDGFYKEFYIENTQFKRINKNYSFLANLENGFGQIRNQLFNELKAQKYADELDAFKPLAANYRRLSEPPTMSEEQRGYIVKANVSLEEKNFNNAIAFFNSAISVDPISYPNAYFNLALTLALTNNYEDAIQNMKKYLLLIPDSVEARDKIYEWELQLQK